VWARLFISSQVYFLWVAFPEPDGSNNNGTIMVSITHQPSLAAFPPSRPLFRVCVCVSGSLSELM